MKKRLVIFFLAAAMVLGGCENKNSKLYKKGIEALEQKDYVTSIAMLERSRKGRRPTGGELPVARHRLSEKPGV